MTANLAAPATVPAFRGLTASTESSPAARERSQPRSGASRGSDFAQLSRRVKEAGLMARRPGYYTVKIALTGALLVGGWTAFVLIGRSWWQLATAVLLGPALSRGSGPRAC